MTVSVSVDRIQGLSGSLAIKVPVLCATTAAITLSGLQTVDGVALADGDRVLVKNQTDKTQNGLYSVTTSSWQRTLDFNRANDAIQGTLVHVYGGNTNSGLWQLITEDPVIETTDLEFAEFATGSGGGSGGGSSSSYYMTFGGDGTTGPFCLPIPPASIADTLVAVDGEIQIPIVDYTISDGCINFTNAPTNGAVIYVSFNTGVTTTASLVTYTYTVTGSEVGNAIDLPYTYTPGCNTLVVFHRGVFEYPPTHYAETDPQTVTFAYDLKVGDVYAFIIGQLVNSGDTLVVADGTITANKLAVDSVTTEKIVDGDVTLAKIEDINYTEILGRTTAGAGAPEAIVVNDFPVLASPDPSADYVLVWDTSAGRHVKLLISAIITAGMRTWKDMLSSRAKNTPYQNNSGVDIFVNINFTGGDGHCDFYTSTDGSTWLLTQFDNYTGQTHAQPVGNGQYYKAVSTGTLSLWTEFRP